MTDKRQPDFYGDALKKIQERETEKRLIASRDPSSPAPRPSTKFIEKSQGPLLSDAQMKEEARLRGDQARKAHQESEAQRQLVQESHRRNAEKREQDARAQDEARKRTDADASRKVEQKRAETDSQIKSAERGSPAERAKQLDRVTSEVQGNAERAKAQPQAESAQKQADQDRQRKTAEFEKKLEARRSEFRETGRDITRERRPPGPER